MDKKPSEMITGFLNFLESASREYESAYADVGKEDCRVQTFLHDMEFAQDKNARNRIATQLQQSRRARRKAKDRAQMNVKVHSFYTDKRTQELLKAIRKLQNEQVTMEKYLFGTREFKKRVE